MGEFLQKDPKAIDSARRNNPRREAGMGKEGGRSSMIGGPPNVEWIYERQEGSHQRADGRPRTSIKRKGAIGHFGELHGHDSTMIQLADVQG